MTTAAHLFVCGHKRYNETPNKANWSITRNVRGDVVHYSVQFALHGLNNNKNSATNFLELRNVYNIPSCFRDYGIVTFKPMKIRSFISKNKYK